MGLFTNETYLKFRKKKTAFYGLLTIVLAALLSLFAYVIIPDDTPNANRQMLDIALKKPGFTYQVLKIPNRIRDQKLGIFSFFTGYAENYEFQPFEEISYEVDHLTIITPLGEQKDFTYPTLLPNILADKDAVKKLSIQKFTSLMGTDRFGRDIFSRIILGIRISLLAGLLAVFVSLFVGVSLGAIAGYFGGWVDNIILYFINIIWSIPTLLLVFAIVLALGRGITVIFIAVGLTMWVDVARLVRGLVMSLKEEQFVSAAVSIGQRPFQILFRHILPNTLGPVLVITAANFATAILVEAGLSYLGFGIEPPAPSLGNLLNENYGYALSGNIYLALFPALAVMLLVLSFNLLGTGLRDTFEVRENIT